MWIKTNCVGNGVVTSVCLFCVMKLGLLRNFFHRVYIIHDIPFCRGARQTKCYGQNKQVYNYQYNMARNYSENRLVWIDLEVIFFIWTQPTEAKKTEKFAWFWHIYSIIVICLLKMENDQFPIAHTVVLCYTYLPLES